MRYRASHCRVQPEHVESGVLILKQCHGFSYEVHARFCFQKEAWYADSSSYFTTQHPSCPRQRKRSDTPAATCECQSARTIATFNVMIINCERWSITQLYRAESAAASFHQILNTFTRTLPHTRYVIAWAGHGLFCLTSSAHSAP